MASSPGIRKDSLSPTTDKTIIGMTGSAENNSHSSYRAITEPIHAVARNVWRLGPHRNLALKTDTLHITA